MKKFMSLFLAAAMLAIPAAASSGVRGDEITWKKSNWTISGEGEDTVCEGKQRATIGYIITKQELEYNCLEYDLMMLDNYGTVDGNVGMCYDCGDTEYFFELNTVGNYLRIRRMRPTEAVKTSNTGYTLDVGKWHHFKYILAENLLLWYIDGKLVCKCTDTSECAMDKGKFLIQGYYTQPRVKNIVFSNAEVATVDYNFEFTKEDNVKMFEFESETDDKPYVADSCYVWPQSGKITSVLLDTAPGDKYSMKMPLRNTFCMRLRNESDTSKIRLSFVTDDHPDYNEKRSKIFYIAPNSDWFTYYFNVSDTEECDGYLRGFSLEPVGNGSGRILIDAITFEREKPIYDYAGSFVSCTADGDTVTAELKLKDGYEDKNVVLYETSITNYAMSKSAMKVVARTTADGADATFAFPLTGGKVSRLSSHFIAECEGRFVSEWFTIENYYDYSVNPYAFETDCSFTVKVTDPPYNAKGDGFTNDTAAIQKAIDDAATNSGGKVVIPGDNSEYGKRYIITNIDVKSNVWLYIDENAVLWQSPRDEDYNYKPERGHDVSIPGINWTHAGLCHNYPLIYAHQAHNVKITGKGTVRLNDCGSECEDGVNGGTIWTGCSSRIHLIALALVECEDVQVSGVTINRANCYHFPLFACSRVYISDITMREATCASGDGIGLSSACHDIKIDRCFMFSNDDAVTMTSSYNDPRGLVWWSAKTDRDNSVHDLEVCHSDLCGGHGLTFITWGTDNPDLSKQEIYNITAYDNVFGGGSSAVGTWCDNPYYGGPFDNSETDDWSPVRDVRIFKNKYDSQCTLLSVKPTSLVTDCGIRSASDFQNGNFERRNGKKDWVSGLSSWSNTGSRNNIIFETDGKNHYATVTGDTRMYEGLYVKKSSAAVTFDAKCKGEAYFFVTDENGRLLTEEKIKENDEFEKTSYTSSFDAGTYFFGVRTVSGASLSVDNFKLTSGTYDENGVKTAGETVNELYFDHSIFTDNKGKNPITYERVTVKTEPEELRYEPAETAANTEAMETSETEEPAPENTAAQDQTKEENTEPAEVPDGKFPTVPVIAAAAAAGAAAAGAAVIVKKKKKNNA